MLYSVSTHNCDKEMVRDDSTVCSANDDRGIDKKERNGEYS
jgi:hypothetical protein